MPIISNYLKNPTIKLSPPALLNDPFESKNARHISDFIYDKYHDEYQGSLINGKRLTEARARTIIKNAPKRTINLSGIFSLSESNRSLLMWAHYADQHKGMVIGIEDDFLDNDMDISIPTRLINTKRPIKVNYDTVRFDSSEFDFTKAHINVVTRQLALKVLTTKSDDWLYEKEHRFILPIALADKIKYTGESMNFGYRLRSAIKRGELEIDMDTKLVSIQEDTPMTDNLYQHMSSNKDFLFLKNINPKKIKSIYFGVRADYYMIKEYLDDIENNKEELGHIKLYNYTLCDERFSLIRDDLDEEDYELL